MNPLHATDAYKLDHRRQYPENTSLVYSNWTPRKSRIKDINEVVLFGLQYFIKRYLMEDFNNNFFKKPKEEVVKAYTRRVNGILGPNKIGTKHIEALHDLGYLPIKIKALPEGTATPIGVPMFTVVNTLPEFFWLTNYFETNISNTVWLPCTSATIAAQYRKILDKYAKETGGDLGFVPFQGHDFSMRGMAGLEAAEMSGAGHLLSFVGSDTIPATDFLETYYNANSEKEMVGVSVAATEHSVMCMGLKDDEYETFKRLITEIYPGGIVSIVSDTWNLWEVLSDYLPRLKNEVLARDGKVVIRPDSGDPVKILTGLTDTEYAKLKDPGQYQLDQYGTMQRKGVIETLWDIFGGSINEKGYKVLDPRIGAIYGDAITMERATAISERLKDKGFASTNVVFGIGSYTYQYNTRDTFGFAMKSTYGELISGENGSTKVEGREIFKDPFTDDGTKKSAKGLLHIQPNEGNGHPELVDQVNWELENEGLLETVFENGKLVKDLTLSEIRNTIANQ